MDYTKGDNKNERERERVVNWKEPLTLCGRIKTIKIFYLCKQFYFLVRCCLRGLNFIIVLGMEYRS